MRDSLIAILGITLDVSHRLVRILFQISKSHRKWAHSACPWLVQSCRFWILSSGATFRTLVDNASPENVFKNSLFIGYVVSLPPVSIWTCIYHRIYQNYQMILFIYLLNKMFTYQACWKWEKFSSLWYHLFNTLLLNSRSLVKPTVMSTSEGLRSYAPRVRGCYFRTERQLRFFKSYSQQKCYRECYSDYLKATCGCVPFAFPSHI